MSRREEGDSSRVNIQSILFLAVDPLHSEDAIDLWLAMPRRSRTRRPTLVGPTVGGWSDRWQLGLHFSVVSSYVDAPAESRRSFPDLEKKSKSGQRRLDAPILYLSTHPIRVNRRPCR
jgi:hypothetical protein